MIFETSPNRELVASVSAACPTSTILLVNELFIGLDWDGIEDLSLDACIAYTKENRYSTLQVTHTGHKLEVSKNGAFVSYESPWFGVNESVFHGRLVVSKNRHAPNFAEKGTRAISRVLAALAGRHNLNVIYHEVAKAA